MIQTPTTRFVFRSDTTCGRPTTTMLESRVAMKIPTVVTVRTTHLYSNRNRHTTSSIFLEEPENHDINSGRRALKPLSFPQLEILMGLLTGEIPPSPSGSIKTSQERASGSLKRGGDSPIISPNRDSGTCLRSRP